MARATARRDSERRAEHLLNDLLDTQGWDRRRPPLGDVLFQSEYRHVPELALILQGASKTGIGHGVPEALLVDRETKAPLAVIEAKARRVDILHALTESQHYGTAFVEKGFHPLCIALAGIDGDFEVRVSKWDGSAWVAVTYDSNPIGWIPTKADTISISAPAYPSELRPSIPPAEVLAVRADEINRLLREASIKDEFRPAVVAAVMLALWQAGKVGSDIRRDPANILKDINSACRDAFIAAGKANLANSIRVDEANVKLRASAKRIADILERLNVAVLTAEHDYLGQLYETFFRYTGGNTIGQYFTPRHIAVLMAELCEVGIDDVVLDPACGTGGFLIAAMDRMLRLHGRKREVVVDTVAKQLIGFESEPTTAALAVANMILRGDGSTGIFNADAFASPNFPQGKATVAMLNPPFPHKKTDTPAEDFVERGLDGLAPRGRLAVILPTSLLAKKPKAPWRTKILKNNRLVAVCQLPDELFQPFAATTTSVVVLEKGVPHSPRKATTFVRMNHDGLVLKKKARVARSTEPNQAGQTIDAILNHKETPGFSGNRSISGGEEWTVGSHISSSTPDSDEVMAAVDVLLRRLTSFYARYAKEVLDQRDALKAGEIVAAPYRSLLSPQRIKNAALIGGSTGSVGSAYDIFYGMKELHSRDGIAPGRTLIISPTEQYNGCYGWLDFDQLTEAPFVTVAQTGSIGEAFVQFEPCAVNDDCLILLPKSDQNDAHLVLLAATLHAEKWRFSYGRKLTPQRIADFKLPDDPALLQWTATRLDTTKSVIKQILDGYQQQPPTPI